MSNLVIVAIPDENDRVWKISSEKAPHLTVLFLGDVDAVANLEQIVLFVEHAANTTLNRFYLPVDRRGELGDDKADVLFFKKGRYDYKAIRDFRAVLLQDNNIKTAYDSSTQFEGPWTPHMTLGYPATPAKEMDDNQDYRFYDVCFNKIAVWIDDFDGPEFLLKDYWDEVDALATVPMDVAMSDFRPDEQEEAMTQSADLGTEFILEHFGVKGMRWGVRNEDIAAVGRAAKSAGGAVGRSATKISRAVGDVQFETRLQDEEKSHAVNMVISSKASQAFKRTDLPALKERHGDYGKMLNRAKKPFSKEARAYRKDARETYIKRLEDAANSMTNVSGTRQYTIRERGWELPKEGGALPSSKHIWSVTSREIKHAAGVSTWDIEVVEDGEGYISDLKPVENAMAQSADLGAAFLLHYGVKGMKWGVRNNTSGAGETKREGIQRYVDPTGHQLSSDIAKTAIGVMVPVVAPLTWPAQIRLIRGGARGVKAKALDRQEKKFAKNAMSPKNFVAIHNGSVEKTNRDIDAINKKYPNGVSKDRPKEQKKYNEEVLKAMQDSYRASANSLTNKAGTRHLDVEFVNDGLDFKIHAREGAPTPLPVRVKHAAEDVADEEITVEITGKIKRDSNGYIIGFEFDHLEQKSMAQSADLSSDLGVEFILEHYGVKGQKWGVRRERGTPGFFETRRAQAEAKTRIKRTPIDPRAMDTIGSSGRKKTAISVKGGEDHPASPDALRVASSQQKLKKSGVHALSNKELQELAQRLNLETQVSVLMGKRIKKGPGKKFVEEQLKKAQDDPIKAFGKGRKIFKAGKTAVKARKLAGVP